VILHVVQVEKMKKQIETVAASVESKRRASDLLAQELVRVEALAAKVVRTIFNHGKAYLG